MRRADYPAGREPADSSSAKRVADFLRLADERLERQAAEVSVAEARGITTAKRLVAEAAEEIWGAEAIGEGERSS